MAYTASKHGVLGIMRGLHLSAVKEGVRVNVVCPWMTSAFPLFLLLFLWRGLKTKICWKEVDGCGADL